MFVLFLQKSGTGCPVVLPAMLGSYALPVAAAENMSLFTRNIPPPVSVIIYSVQCPLVGDVKKWIGVVIA